ncbi:MAG: PBECR2 nuclease fold domain-containing protein [Cyanobacteria bacterium P01_A01_bin.137]
MSRSFYCPYLNDDVELSDEREQHIIARHPGTLPNYSAQLAQTLSNPDQIRQSTRDEKSLLFSKWFETIRTGRYLVVVTISDNDPVRHWIITAYTARKLSGGETIWPTDA